MKEWNPTPEDIARIEREIDAFDATQGSQKMWNYFLELSKTEHFQGLIKRWRKVYNIPLRGFSGAKNQWSSAPQEWKYWNAGLLPLDKEIGEFCLKYRLPRLDWVEVVKSYLFYNRLKKPIWNEGANNLLMFEDLAVIANDPYSKETTDDDNRFYPLAIRISPYATKRDIIDYVNKIYSVRIKPYQNTYKEKGIRIGKVRSKNKGIQKYYDFVYKNRNLKLREIAESAEKKFKGKFPYDIGEIGKIRSLEIKRRKEV